MNALAEDQARRIATRIWNSPDLRDRVTAGMYADAEPQDASPSMLEDDVIRSRRAMHEHPPDILLTNYRMLDSLLVRPERKGLWEQNTPETLRFLVVDELHTFDGAQGTDLACLIRRLKDRLAVPKGSLCCIGTSATLGDRNDTKPVIDYARELFDEEFDCQTRWSQKTARTSPSTSKLMRILNCPTASPTRNWWQSLPATQRCWIPSV